jgi:hypothetical protein
MCQAKPGPRCSNHQTKTFQSKLAGFATALKGGDIGQTEFYIHAFNRELAELNATPIGQKILQQRILASTSPAEVKRLKEQKRVGADLRSARKVALETGGKEINPPYQTIADGDIANVLNSHSDFEWYNKNFNTNVVSTAKSTNINPSRSPYFDREFGRNRTQTEAMQGRINELHNQSAKVQDLKLSKQGKGNPDLTPNQRKYTVINLDHYEDSHIRSHNPDLPYWKNAADLRIQEYKRLIHEEPNLPDDYKQHVKLEMAKRKESEKNTPEYQKSLTEINTPPRKKTAMDKINAFFDKMPKVVSE